MKLTDRVTELEQQLLDSNAQIQQLRDELVSFMGQAGVDTSKASKKPLSIELGKRVHELMRVHSKHPYVKDRDVFTSRHMFEFITGAMDDSEKYGLVKGTNLDFHYNRGIASHQLRLMCQHLVDSGLFIKRKVQWYLPAMHDIEEKATTRRGTVLVARDFDKYKDLSPSQLHKHSNSQERIANIKYADSPAGKKALEEHNESVRQAATTELDTEVSFL